jgi:hypothetical protein
MDGWALQVACSVVSTLVADAVGRWWQARRWRRGGAM